MSSCYKRAFGLSFWKTWLSYFSQDIQNELTELLGARVCQTIISSIQQAKCYHITSDTIPHNAHIKQMLQIVRFFEIQHDSVESKMLLVGVRAAHVNVQALTFLVVWNICLANFHVPLTSGVF
jgi:hypothetical protein